MTVAVNRRRAIVQSVKLDEVNGPRTKQDKDIIIIMYSVFS